LHTKYSEEKPLLPGFVSKPHLFSTVNSLYTTLAAKSYAGKGEAIAAESRHFGPSSCGCCSDTSGALVISTPTTVPPRIHIRVEVGHFCPARAIGAVAFIFY